MKRPFGVTILIGVVLIFTSLNFFRVSTAIRLWDYLVEPPLNTPVIYLVISGIIWSGLGLTLAFGFVTRQKWSSVLAKISAIVYSSHYWFDRLLIADRSGIGSRWFFALGLTILLLVLTFIILAQPKTRAFLVK